ncbi:fasciclin domain-containing protein [Halioxenophilus aromaticivorans]|uniref:FAS1 domain-containing protein n=1 Tax=Halioxenophilus aromaticivorans TaxID=1306992 RepID=A0AAV3U678_9ALTE
MRQLINTFLIAFLALLVTACDGDDDNNLPDTVVDAAVAEDDLTTLVTALEATGLDQVLADSESEFTVFAPTDGAFALLGEDTINALLSDTDTLASILTYHVLGEEVSSQQAIDSAGSTTATVNGELIALSLDGDELLVNTATVIRTDIRAKNGVIHVLDAVLIPPAPVNAEELTIVEVAADAGTFNTLIAAVQAAELDAALADPEAEFTVFAPTDDAFAALPQGTVEALLSDIPALTAILTQHVISGQVDSITAYSLNGQTAPTLNEAVSLPIEIDSVTDELIVGGAVVTMADIQTANGIIHVIDAVIVDP